VKKRKVIILLVLICVLVFSSNILAKCRKEKECHKNILTIYKTNDDYYSAGIKIHYKAGVYFGGNIEYHRDCGVNLELNSVYMIPDIFIFDFYGGGGVKINFLDEETDLHILLGSQFFFFFAETKYYLSENEVEYRSGFKFDF
jgi:hypothetical protein